jgi:hypothetical protein
MKLIRHYLKYDFLRWRTLCVLLVVLLVSYDVLMWQLARAEVYEPWLSKVADATKWVWWLVFLVMLTLSYLLGHADGPVMSRSWQRTRPRHALPLLVARWSLLVCGILLFTLAHGLSLWFMKFPLATVARQTLSGTGLITGWAFVWFAVGWFRPNFPGLILGGFVGSLVLGFGMAMMASHIKVGGISVESGLFLSAVLVVLARLFGRKSLTQRQWVWLSFGTGLFVFAGVLGIVVFGGVVAQRSVAPVADAFAGAPEFTVTESEKLFLQVSEDEAAKDLLYLPLPRLMRSTTITDGENQVVKWAWRRPGEAWSEWIRAESGFGSNDILNYNMWILNNVMGDLTTVELRLAITSHIKKPNDARLALQRGAMIEGKGENVIVTTPNAGNLGWSAVGHTLLGWGTSDLLDMNAVFEPPNESGSTSRSQHQLSTPCVWLTFSQGSHLRRNGGIVTPQGLVFRRPPVEETKRCLIHLTNVTIERQSVPSVIRPRSNPPRVLQPLKPNRDSVPWLVFAVEHVPGAHASEREVVEYFHGLADCTSQQSLTFQQQQRLTLLVKRWFPHFINMMQQAVPQDVVQRALIQGTPEEWKDKLVQQIPAAPALAMVAAERGWQVEMKDQVLQVAQQEGPLPSGWAALLRSYRDPVFHPALRRAFIADLPTVRYWQSMPDLAIDLPARLKAVHAGALMSLDLSKDPVAWAFVDAGDGVMLERLLEIWRKRGTQGTDFAQAMKRYLRPPDGRRLSNDSVFDALGHSAADYDYDPARRCWIRKPQPSNP